MLNIVVWLVVGAAIGGVAGLLMRGEEDDAVFTNVVVGIVGAVVAAWFAAPEAGLRGLSSRAVGLGLGAVAMALLGAVALLVVLAVYRHLRARRS